MSALSHFTAQCQDLVRLSVGIEDVPGPHSGRGGFANKKQHPLPFISFQGHGQRPCFAPATVKWDMAALVYTEEVLVCCIGSRSQSSHGLFSLYPFAAHCSHRAELGSSASCQAQHCSSLQCRALGQGARTKPGGRWDPFRWGTSCRRASFRHAGCCAGAGYGAGRLVGTLAKEAPPGLSKVRVCACLG